MCLAPSAPHGPEAYPRQCPASGSWVYFPSFFQTDANTSGADEAAAATLLQVAWRLHKAYAAVNAADAAVHAAATKLQRAARRHLQGRNSCKPRTVALEPQPAGPEPEPEPETEPALARFPAGYWARPLTTLVLERVSPSRMSWKKEKENQPQVAAATSHSQRRSRTGPSLCLACSHAHVASLQLHIPLQPATAPHATSL